MYRKGRKEGRDERDEGTKGGGKVAVGCVIIKIMRIMMCKCMCESESKNERKAHVTKIIPAMMELPPNLLVLSTENTPRQAEKPQGPSLMCNIFAFMCVSLPRKS